MRKKTYNILFRIVSFGADKTNGFRPLVKYKLALGTLILGLTACGNGGEKNKIAEKGTASPIGDIAHVKCYKIATVSDTVPALPIPQVVFTPPVIVCYDAPLEAPPEPQIMCYEVSIVPDTVANKRESSEDKIYTIAEVMSAPPQGDNLGTWLKKNTLYPQKLKDEGVEGRVIVRLLIGKQGDIENVQVVRSLSPEADAEAVRLMKSSGVWSPAMQDGKPVRSYFNCPVTFRQSR